MSMRSKLWFFTYTFRTQQGRREPAMDTFEGTFPSLILYCSKHNLVIGKWVELTAEEYDELKGEL